MAIYLNDAMLKPDPKGNKLEREYHAGLQKVNDLFEKFKVEGNDAAYLQIARKDAPYVLSMTSGKRKKVPPIALPATIPFYDDEMGAVTIRYSTAPPQRTPNNTFTWTTKYIQFREMLTLTDKQKDLAWFLLFASNLVQKGIYQLVDIKSQYEGTFNDILTKKNVIDAITANDADLLKMVASTFISESLVTLDRKELVGRVYEWLEKTKKWDLVWGSIEHFNSKRKLSTSNLSELEYEGEQVIVTACPASVSQKELIDQAKELNIKITTPPQRKDILYSLIEHVKKQKIQV